MLTFLETYCIADISPSKATALVTERLSAAKGPPQPPDPKNTRSQVNNSKDLDVEIKKEDQGFFGSFFAPKKDSKKKGAAAMDTPPPAIKPQSALNERETMETEVISTFLFLHS